ncbi:unnamed protein product [Caretta caretta]
MRHCAFHVNPVMTAYLGIEIRGLVFGRTGPWAISRPHGPPPSCSGEFQALSNAEDQIQDLCPLGAL